MKKNTFLIKKNEPPEEFHTLKGMKSAVERHFIKHNFNIWFEFLGYYFWNQIQNQFRLRFSRWMYCYFQFENSVWTNAHFSKLLQYFAKLNIRITRTHLQFIFLLSLILVFNGLYSAVQQIFRFEDHSEEGILTVRVMRTELEDFQPGIESSGKIEYFDKVDIVSVASGRIEKIYKNIGDTVQKGEILVQMDPFAARLQVLQATTEYNSALSQLTLASEKYLNARSAVEIRKKQIEKQKARVKKIKANLDKMRTTFRGKSELSRAGALSSEEFNSVKTQLISDEAEYVIALKDLETSMIGFRDSDITDRGLKIPVDIRAKKEVILDINTGVEKAELETAKNLAESRKNSLISAKLLLEKTKIRSPINGVVAARNKSPGEEVNGGEKNDSSGAILVVVDIGSVYAPFTVRESDIYKIKPGMKAEIHIGNNKSDSFPGEISIISPVSDIRSHSFLVKVLIANDQWTLKPGMFFRGKIFSRENIKRIFIPESSLYEDQNNNVFVYTVEKSIIKKKKILPGMRIGGRIEVQEGLLPGETLCLEKVTFLKERMQVNPLIQTSYRIK